MRTFANHVRKAFACTLVILIAVVLALALAEIVLRIDGRYSHLASREFACSPAIWEPLVNRVEFDTHPDLHLPVEARFDDAGVRNHSGPSTREKQNIIAFFGDSFTENRRMADRFTFTTILDLTARPRGRVVNYGVDGYGLDQSYLRYRKYEMHDIRHVVYVFCRNDLSDLHETGLTEITPDGEVAFKAAHINSTHRLTGRLHTTYLILSAYYDMMRHTRLHGRSDDVITADFLSPTPSANVLRLAKTYVLLLNKWKNEVESGGRTFTVLVLPRKIDMDVATELLAGFDGRIVQSHSCFREYTNYTFRNDAHWNERGNLRMAEFIMTNVAFPFCQFFAVTNLTDTGDQIEQYYRSTN